MIERYSCPEMAVIFTDESRLGRYLEIELLAMEAQVALGVVPRSDAEKCRSKAIVVDSAFVADVAERERITDHDVAAFVDVAQQRIGMPKALGFTTDLRVQMSWTLRCAGCCMTHQISLSVPLTS